MNQEIQQPTIDLKKTVGLTNELGEPLFLQGVILRKVSRFVAATEDDAILPIPVFYHPETYKLVSESVPADLREELKEYIH